jgi:glycosyltransferase involved in cell wall biosynthesis
MRDDEQLHLAKILNDCARRLEDSLTRLEDSARPGAINGETGDESLEAAELLDAIDTVAKRIVDVENALHEDLGRRRRRRALPAALKQWAAPRLGILRHHLPELLRVPTYYLRTTPKRDAPAVSIVTPSYEQGRYLERTIYSVLNQNYPQLEYVVQDGGSSDETKEVLERFDGNLSHWASEHDDGQADAINRGFAHTSGEIMAYLNSDDLLLPGSIAYVANYFVTHPEVDAVYGHRILIDEHDRQIGSWVLPPHDGETLAFADYIPQETLFWRRELWERAGGRIDPGLRFALDWDLLLRFRDVGAKMVRLPRFLGAFRVHAEQKTTRELEVCEAETRILQRRVLGRALSDEEINVRVRPYLRRHVLYHTLHRVEARLPLPRINVRTMPREAALKQAEVSSFDMR